MPRYTITLRTVAEHEVTVEADTMLAAADAAEARAAALYPTFDIDAVDAQPTDAGLYPPMLWCNDDTAEQITRACDLIEHVILGWPEAPADLADALRLLETLPIRTY